MRRLWEEKNCSSHAERIMKKIPRKTKYNKQVLSTEKKMLSSCDRYLLSLCAINQRRYVLVYNECDILYFCERGHLGHKMYQDLYYDSRQKYVDDPSNGRYIVDCVS